MSELGIIAAAGPAKVAALAAIVRDPMDARLPAAGAVRPDGPVDQLDTLSEQVERLEREIVTEHRGKA
ncbi:hypothetical protein NKH34_30360 [Mesorhizobium sp. M1148]|uniref:hypothetical protein n=1 Tax=unclassified Mesorhizobium TaxID=325217 RepID=UPI00333BD35C